MASIVRQPFAPLDNARLQNLTSIKNRQSALSTSPPTKRKAADVLDPADFENLDPSLFKRSKGDNKPSAKGLSSFFPNKEIYKSAIILTEKKPSNTIVNAAAPISSSTPLSPLRSVTSPRRQILNPKSPSKLGSVFAKSSSPLTTPAGRSPPRSKRAGILGSSRRRSSTYSRIDPPKYGSPTPFSLDAALKGTIPSYAARASSSLATAASIAAGSVSKASSKFTSLDEPTMKGEWFFDIHEDTPEQEMTNMLQHSTCTLDISSDEESEQKQRREHDEGRDKENIPPPDDVSQTRRRLVDSAEAVDENAMIVEKIVARQALADLDASAYWAEGCDSESVFVVPGDEDAETVIDENEVLPRLDEEPRNFEFSQRENVSATYLEPIVEVNSSFESKLDEPVAIFEDQSIPQSEELDIPTLDQIIDVQPTVEDLMMGPFQQKPAAVLEPVEGTTAGESFEVWESGSAKDENEPPSPVEVEV